jgi:hypothetical protein
VVSDDVIASSAQGEDAITTSEATSLFVLWCDDVIATWPPYCFLVLPFFIDECLKLDGSSFQKNIKSLKDEC